MLDRIKLVLEEANYVLEGRYWLLEQTGGGDDDDDIINPPWMTTTGNESHAYFFNEVFMPPSGNPSTWPGHPMWDFYQTFMNLVGEMGSQAAGGGLIGDFVGLGLQQGVGGILTFPQFVSLIRFVLRPHIGEGRWPTEWLNALLDFLGVEWPWLQDLILSMLRQWMIENLDIGHDIMCQFFPSLCEPMRGPEEWEPGMKGVHWRPESMKPVYVEGGDSLASSIAAESDDGIGPIIIPIGNPYTGTHDEGGRQKLYH